MGLLNEECHRVAGFAAATFAIVVATQVSAQDAATFYKERNIQLVVSAAPGGGYDLYARILARHIGKHVPGHPTVVVRNLPGAAGLSATRYVLGAAPHDGSVLLANQAGPLAERVFSQTGK